MGNGKNHIEAKMLRHLADSLRRKETILNILNMDWLKEADNFIKGYLCINDISEIDISDYGIRYSYNENGESYDYDLCFVGLDIKDEVIAKTYYNNIFRFSELEDVIKFKIINSIIKENYGNQ